MPTAAAPQRKTIRQPLKRGAIGSLGTAPISVDQEIATFDPISENKQTGEVGHREDQTDQAVPAMTRDLIEKTARIHENWEKKRQEQGKRVYHCPVCKIQDRENFTTKKKCEEHIKKNHKNQVILLKRDKVNKEFYEPQLVILDPPKTIADILGIEGADNILLTQKATENQREINQMQILAGDAKMTAEDIMSKGTHNAIELLPQLSDAELKKVGYKSYMAGKSDIYRAVDKLATSRGIQLEF